MAVRCTLCGARHFTGAAPCIHGCPNCQPPAAPVYAPVGDQRTVMLPHPVQAIDHINSALADQAASGRTGGGGAVPGRYGAATVIGRPEAGQPWTGTVEPAAGPAESCPAAAGRNTPDTGTCPPCPG